MGTTPCKICGDPHVVDAYKGMRFYVCPRTNKVYLIAQEDRNVRTEMHVGTHTGPDLGDPV